MLKKLLFNFTLFISLVSIGQTELPYEFFNNSDYADSEIYVGLVGRFGSDDVWMDMTTSSIELMSADLNTIPGPEWSTPEGWTYPDIFTPLSEIDNNTITIPHGLYGCRIFISFESPMYLRFHATGGYAGANLGLDSDPNNGIRWELIELSWGNSGLWTNTSRVDAYQYPIAVEVNGFQGDVGLPTYAENYERAISGEGEVKYQIIGEKLSHEEIMAAWDLFVDEEYLECKEIAAHSIDGEPVIHQPTKVDLFPDNILDDYIDEVWETYKTQDLVIEIGILGYWTGRVNDDNEFNFVDSRDGSVATIYGKPTTVGALEGSGFMAYTPVSSADDLAKHNEDLMIQAQISAALTRHAIYTDIVGPERQDTHDADRFYIRDPHNQYAAFFHQESISHDSKTYAFAYDDVGDHSATIQTTFPTQVRVIIGGYDGYVAPEPELLTMTISPNIDEIEVGNSQQFTVTGYDTFGELFETNETWIVSGGGTISDSGLFTATTEGDYTITATDGDISRTVNITVIGQAPDFTGCENEASTGDYSYQATNDTENPSITFVPTVAGNGDSTCLLFYGTDPDGTYGATSVDPNVPFQINASEGEIVYFYYVYSLASGGQNDTSGNRHSFIVGDCETVLSNNEFKVNSNSIAVYPNPVYNNTTTITNLQGNSIITIYALTGQIVKEVTSNNSTQKELDLSSIPEGMYFLKVSSEQGDFSTKLIKQ